MREDLIQGGGIMSEIGAIYLDEHIAAARGNRQEEYVQVSLSVYLS